MKSGKIVQAGVQLDLCQQSFCVLGGCGFTRAEAINCFFGCQIRKPDLPLRWRTWMEGVTSIQAKQPVHDAVFKQI